MISLYEPKFGLVIWSGMNLQFCNPEGHIKWLFPNEKSKSSFLPLEWNKKGIYFKLCCQGDINLFTDLDRVTKGY